MADVQRIEGIPLRQRAEEAYAAELRELAAQEDAAEAKREREREQERQAAIEALRVLLRTRLGLHDDVVTRVDAPVVEIDGVLLGAGEVPYYGVSHASLYEYGRCAACGALYPLRDIENMADLAAPYTGGEALCDECESGEADDDADG